MSFSKDNNSTFVKIVIIVFCVLLVLSLMLPSLASIMGRGKGQQQAQTQQTEQQLPTVEELNASYEASIKSLDERLQADPHNASIITNIADSYFAWGQQVMMLNKINGAQELDDNAKTALTHAVEYYDKAIEIEPSSALSAHRALSLYYAGSKEEGIKDMEKLASSATDYPQAYANLGMMQEEQGDIDAALKSYDSALSHSGDQKESINNYVMGRVSALMQSGKVSQDVLPDQIKTLMTSQSS